jgi:hypothetical protein
LFAALVSTGVIIVWQRTSCSSLALVACGTFVRLALLEKLGEIFRCQKYEKPEEKHRRNVDPHAGVIFDKRGTLFEFRQIEHVNDIVTWLVISRMFATFRSRAKSHDIAAVVDAMCVHPAPQPTTRIRSNKRVLMIGSTPDQRSRKSRSSAQLRVIFGFVLSRIRRQLFEAVRLGIAG